MAALASQSRMSEGPIPSKTEVESDYRHPSPEAMERWYDLKYGFRIHWGLYALKPVAPESWPLTQAGDAAQPLSSGSLEFMAWYHQQYKTWNPAGFDAGEWIAFMRRGGMKFFVFTTKHHEGFCMFDTATRVKKRFVYSGPNAGTIAATRHAVGACVRHGQWPDGRHDVWPARRRDGDWQSWPRAIRCMRA